MHSFFIQYLIFSRTNALRGKWGNTMVKNLYTKEELSFINRKLKGEKNGSFNTHLKLLAGPAKDLGWLESSQKSCVWPSHPANPMSIPPPSPTSLPGYPTSHTSAASTLAQVTWTTAVVYWWVSLLPLLSPNVLSTLFKTFQEKPLARKKTGW